MKILNVEKITEFKFINLFSIQYKDRLNTVKNWIFVSRSRAQNPLAKKQDDADAVVIVPYHTDKKKLVIIEEFRVPLGGYQYGFPAGLVDENETIEKAGKRELFEETGLTVEKVLKKSPAVYSSSGLSDESVCMLFVECSGNPSSEMNEASEDIRVKFVSQKDAQQLLSGTKKIMFDVKTWIVLNTFAEYGVI